MLSYNGKISASKRPLTFLIGTRMFCPPFNDDIQGTGAVVHAGLLASMRKIGQKLSDQVFVIHGAGAGGVGVARQICRGMEREGTSPAAATARMLTLDLKGL